MIVSPARDASFTGLHKGHNSVQKRPKNRLGNTLATSGHLSVSCIWVTLTYIAITCLLGLTKLSRLVQGKATHYRVPLPICVTFPLKLLIGEPFEMSHKSVQFSDQNRLEDTITCRPTTNQNIPLQTRAFSFTMSKATRDLCSPAITTFLRPHQTHATALLPGPGRTQWPQRLTVPSPHTVFSGPAETFHDHRYLPKANSPSLFIAFQDQHTLPK